MMKRQAFELVRGDTWTLRDAEIALESGDLEDAGVSSSISIKLSPKDTTALIEVAGVVEDETTASWTLSAARRFDVLAMVALVGLAAGHVDWERLAAMKEKLREFEMYEARHRGN